VRGIVQQPLTLGQILVDQSEFTLLEIAQAAMHHLRGLRRSAGGEVVLLDQRGLEPPTGCIECYSRTRHTTTDDEDIEALFGQAAQRVLAAKPVHRPSLPHGLRVPNGAQAAAGGSAKLLSHTVGGSCRPSRHAPGNGR
jgi:hypothetical protein